MKRLLVLSGSHTQIPIIKKARELGHYVITCDYLEDNPGHQYAHEYYNVSTTDKEGVLSLAQKLKIDGIVCYASDPAAATAAYVGEKLELPSQPYEAVEILSNKEQFRKFLRENHFKVPKAKGYSSYEEIKADFHQFNLPVIIKPVDSSGSKGVAKIESIETLEEKVVCALRFSRMKRFIVEEFIAGYHVGGDGFSVNGKLVFRCFVNQKFPSNSSPNPFAPIGSSYPCLLPEYLQTKMHNEIQKVLDLLKMKTGAYNFDIRIDDKEDVYLIEIGARNGGGGLQNIVKYGTGFKLIENILYAALGEDCDLSQSKANVYWGCYYLHSAKNGVFEAVDIVKEFYDNYVVEYKLLVKPGDSISAFTGAHALLGTMILKFSSKDEMVEKMGTITDWVKVIVEEPISVMDYTS